MDQYLQFCRASLAHLKQYKTIHLVLGNESCDLDSAVSAIVLAYIKYHELISSGTVTPSSSENGFSSEVLVLPLLNVFREDLHLRREIVFWIEKVLQFDLKWLICRNEIDFNALNSSSAQLFISLVDHNENKDITRLLPRAKIDEIIDHHKVLTEIKHCDPSKVRIDTGVGSCCSLIALRFFESRITHKFGDGPQETRDSQIALILYGPILLDTVCFDPKAKRFNSKDYEAINKLEDLMKHPSDVEPSLYDRNEVYQRLVNAKNSLDGLSFNDLLRKDMKVVESLSDNNLAICVSSMTGILLTELSLRDKLKELKSFCNEPSKTAVFSDSRPRSFAAIVLMTFDNRIPNDLRRQLAIYCSNKHLMRTIATCFERSELELEPITALESLRIYNQNNLTASRKVVLPIISTILNGPGRSDDPKRGDLNTNGNGDLTTSAPSSFIQQPDSYYGSFIEDSFVGEFVGDYIDPEAREHGNILVMDADGQNLVMKSPAETTCISHPHEIEFNFDSFGPESIIFAPDGVNNKADHVSKKETESKPVENEPVSVEVARQESGTDPGEKAMEPKSVDSSEASDSNLNPQNFNRNGTLTKSQRKKVVPEVDVVDFVFTAIDPIPLTPSDDDELKHASIHHHDELPKVDDTNSSLPEKDDAIMKTATSDPLGVTNSEHFNYLNPSTNLLRQPSMKKKVPVNYDMFLKSSDEEKTPPIDASETKPDFVGVENSKLCATVANQNLESLNQEEWRPSLPLGNNEIRHIDMKAIEPYKKVISHGGHLQPSANGNACHECSSSAVIVFAAYYLPDRSRPDYHYVMDNLFLYVVSTLHNMVADDYILIYLHNGTSSPSSCSAAANNMPTISWLKRCYQMIDRKLKKNLKGLYIVHPTFWLKTLIIMCKPFISSKFSRKLQFVKSLEELKNMIPIGDLEIPDAVKF